jgi:hypothetical protein
MKGNENMNTNLVINISKIRGYKNAFYAVSLILIFAISLGMAFAPTASAQVGIAQPEQTAGYISVAPTLVGVGQKATVNLWLFPLPDDRAYQASYEGYNGITVTFTKPDGTKDTFEPVDATGIYAAGQTQSLGALYFYYAPDEAGNWSVSFTMPAQNVTDSTGTVQYSGCTSNTDYFTVQTTAVNAGLLDGYPWAQLPNSNVYWSYPINSNNREWSAISGDWLGSYLMGLTINGVTSRLYQPYGSGPDTAHIVWSIPYKAGGIIGGAYSSLSYTSALNFASATIMDGKVFINIPNEYKFECIDLTTGQILYTAPGQITCGIHLPGNPFAQNMLSTPGQTPVVLASYGNSPTSYLFSAGGALLLAGNTWNYYDPTTGALLISIENVSVASYYLVDGSNMVYGTTLAGQLFAWNMSQVISNTFLTQIYTPAGTTLIGDWPTGIMWTQPLPKGLSAGNLVLSAAPTIFATSTDASIIVIRSNPNQFWGYSAEDGTQLWNLTLTYPVLENEQISLYGVNDFIVWNPVATTFVCYSLTTGALLWTSPSFSSSPWATTWTVYGSETNDQNNFYAMFPDGTIAAMSLATGQLVWHSKAIPSTEYTANAVPYVDGLVMVGGNIYAYAGYSVLYQQNPISRFNMMTCTNATTGDITWTLNGGVFPVAAADGYVIGLGINDGNLYCIGKGQTSTTVSVPQTTITAGTTVIISGTVLDQSAGQPNTPAISDASMSEWMDYQHMQNSTLLNAPPDCTGVPVTLTAISSTGTIVNLGTVTSDGDGHFAYLWTPTTAGFYTIYATFAGTNSYFESYAETAANVATTAVSPTPTPTTTPTAFVTSSTLMTYIVVAVIVMIIAIAVATVLILRRHP